VEIRPERQEEQRLKIGILGAGQVGGTLGRVWQKKGHEVWFGVRAPKSAGEVTLAEAKDRGEILLLSVPWGPAEEYLKSAGDFAGRVLMDATNPIRADFGGLTAGTNDSGGEQVARWASGARVVKVFNTVGFNVMENPVFAEGRPSMPYCGDDAEAKRLVGGLVEDAGFDGLDAGPLTQSRYLEPMAMLWITMAIQHGYGREMAFRLMRR
jgi:predicted dinucleotide-binding enzyme